MFLTGVMNFLIVKIQPSDDLNKYDISNKSTEM